MNKTHTQLREKKEQLSGKLPSSAEEGKTRHQEKYREATFERSGRGGAGQENSL
jgi:hypothetical protein